MTEAEVDDRMRELLGPGHDEKELKRCWPTKIRRDVSRDNLLRMKAIQWLVDNADVTEVEYEPEDDEARHRGGRGGQG